MDPLQLRMLIRHVLTASNEFNYQNETIVELLMLIAAVESELGRYVFQIQGPALGIFQMEPATHDDLWRNFIKYRGEVRRAIMEFCVDTDMIREDGTVFHFPASMQLAWNLGYAIACARLQLRRFPFELPIQSDPEQLALIWKEHWNTPLGKGTVEQAVHRYKKLCL